LIFKLANDAKQQVIPDPEEPPPKRGSGEAEPRESKTYVSLYPKVPTAPEY
jgi:hypothetical protein